MSRSRALGVLVGAAVVTVAFPAGVSATVTSQVSGAGPDTLIVRGDAAGDTIRIECAADGNVVVNAAPPPGPPLACAATRSITVSGGADLDYIYMTAVRPPQFTTPLAVSIDADPLNPDAATGSDYIRATAFDDRIGFCDPAMQVDEVYDDNVAGGPGDDLMCGGKDQDFLRGQGGDDVIRGGAGEDDIQGSGGDDRLFGNAGSDFFRGGPGRDLIAGGPGKDSYVASIGRDEVRSVELGSAGRR